MEGKKVSFFPFFLPSSLLLLSSCQSASGCIRESLVRVLPLKRGADGRTGAGDRGRKGKEARRLLPAACCLLLLAPSLFPPLFHKRQHRSQKRKKTHVEGPAKGQVAPGRVHDAEDVGGDPRLKAHRRAPAAPAPPRGFAAPASASAAANAAAAAFRRGGGRGGPRGGLGAPPPPLLVFVFIVVAGATGVAAEAAGAADDGRPRRGGPRGDAPRCRLLPLPLGSGEERATGAAPARHHRRHRRPRRKRARDRHAPYLGADGERGRCDVSSWSGRGEQHGKGARGRARGGRAEIEESRERKSGTKTIAPASSTFHLLGKQKSSREP